MLITMKTWNVIREEFDQSEKDQLNAAITGQTLCPKGIVIDDKVLLDDLAKKINEAKDRAMRSSSR